MKKRNALLLCASLAAMAWLGLAENAFAQEWVKMMHDPNTNFYEIQRNFNAYWEGKTAEKGQGWMPFKRWEYFMEPRVFPTGNRPDPGRASRAFVEYLQSHNGSPENANWTSLGPSAWVNGNSGYNPGLGRINGTAVHPTNSSIVFAGSPSGGLWKSTDGGATWSTATDNLSSIGVTSIAINPSTPNTMYIATGDGDASDNYSIGVLKSTDGGSTWNTTGLNWTITQFRVISKLLIHPTNPNILLAAGSSGVYKTTDAGVTWTQTFTGSLKDLEFKPSDPSTIYASGSQFYRSTDTGGTFSLITSGLPASGTVNRLAIGVGGANSSYVYILASSASNSGFYGLYRSVDSGVSFALQSSSPNILGYAQDGSSTGGQGWYDLAIAVAPTNADEIYTGGINVWKSTDGGVTWTNKSYWVYNGTPAYTHADVHTLDFHGTILYAGSDGGIFKSTDGGTAWTDLTAGLRITQIYRIGGYPTDANLLYAGAQDNGSNRYSGTSTWTHVFGADGMEAAIDYTNSNTVYVCYQNGGLLKSTNGGSTFSSAKGNITENGAWITPYVLDPTNPQILYAGYVNVWKTTNGGTSWSPISNFTGSTFNTLAVAPSNPNYIYASKFSTLYRTTDGGVNWTTISTGLPGLYISYIAIASNDPNKIWVTLSAYTSGQKVYASTDGGSTWTNYSGTLPNLPINCITYANSSNDALYIGGDVGIYYRDNSLADWQLYSTNLPNVIVNELEVHQGAGKLRAATYGRGLWESPLMTPGTSSLSINDVTVTEGDAGTTNATFTVTLSPTSTQTVTVNYATANGTATAGSDYTASSGTVTFPAGSTTQNISVSVTGDLVYESAETFFVNLSNATNAAISDAQGIGTIIDNDADVVIWMHPDVTDINLAQKARQRGLSEAQVRAMAQRPESHSALQAALTANGKNSIIVSDITAVNLSQFDALFVILGVFPNNHVVLNNSTEALAIANYIQAGGKVYMEGADMWDYDPASAGGHNFGPLFGLDGIADGTNDLGTVLGQAGAFTQNMNYTYSGQNNFIDHLTTVGSGFVIHSNQTPVYNAGIAYSNTANNSKTVGNSFEFGGLNDNSASSFTKTDLMMQYLIHLGLLTPTTITINDVSVTEGANAVLTASLSSASTQTVTVNYATANGTATAGNDYTAASGTLTFPAGTTTQSATIATSDDGLDEPSETFFINLSNATNAAIADAQGIATLLDNDPTPSISINDITVTEGNTGTVNANLTVSLSAASGQAVSVNYATANGTATAGSDYVAGSGTINFTTGSPTQTLTIVVNGDVLDEPNETFLVNLSNPVNATIADNQGQGTITDDDAAPSITINDVSVTEGNVPQGGMNANFTVTLSAASGQAVSVNYATANGTATAGSDYVSGSGTVNIAAGSTTQTFTVAVNGDLLDEPDETFFVNLSGATNATIADNQGQCTITDDDAGPAITINDVSVNEGNAGTVNASFTVSLSTASGQQVTVNYATADGSATAGSDYAAGSGTVTFTAGVTTQTVNVTVNGDAVIEPNETFFVNLSAAVNATIADAQGQGTILNDDGVPSLSINDVSVTEGNTGTVNANFTVTLSATSSQTVTVNYATANGTATAGSDYVAGSGTLTFTAGTTTQTFNVAVNGDLLDEPNETFFVNLSGATNATIADNQGQCTITDDDAGPAITINDVSVNEGNAGTVNASFTVSLSTASGQQVTVNYATADGSATAGSDYAAGSGTVTFTAGVTTQTVNLTVNGDAVNEPNETFFVNLSAAVNATIADAQGQGTILNDDTTTPPDINVTPASLTFTVPLGGTASASLTIANTAAAGAQTLSWNITEVIAKPALGADQKLTASGEPVEVKTPASAQSNSQPTPVFAGAGAIGESDDPEATLYDQMNFPGTFSIASQNFETANDAFDCRGADDFVISTGTWRIDQVEVTGIYFNGSGPANSVNVWFYTNASGLPGTVLYSAANLTPTAGLTTGSFVLALPIPAVLNAGTYWLAVQANQDLSVTGQWGWTERTVQSASASAWQNPGGGFANVCTSWGSRLATCGVGSSGPDLLFRLSGTVVGTACNQISESPTNGSVAPGGSQTVTVTVNTTGLTLGTYACNIVIHSNDPDEEPVTIPVTVNVINPTNLALNKPATASSSNSSFPPSRANDGITTTHWRSGTLSSTTVVWWRVDLGTTYSINKVVINWQTTFFAKKYTIQTSLTGSSWTTVYTDNLGNGGIDNVTFPTATTRYVRVRITQNNSTTERINEVEVYAASSALGKSVAENESAAVPDKVELRQNYPNPFSANGTFGNPTTGISFSVPGAMHVKLKIYNLTGQEVATLVDAITERGNYNVTFDASGLKSGLYFSVLQAGEVRQVRRLLFLK